MSHRNLKFYWVDVFSEKRFEGNQLAVFTDARSLKAEVMQAIAREMNLSESIFITGSETLEDGSSIFRARIFTKEGELPFAGHPTLGASHVLRSIYCLDAVQLELEVGTITVSFRESGGRTFGEMIQKDPVFGTIHPGEKVASILGVKPEDIDERLPVQTVSTGNPFVMVLLKNLDLVRNIRPDIPGMEDYLRNTDAKAFYITSLDTVDKGAILHARMIAKDGEDPATGSAAGPAAAWLLKNEIMRPEELNWIEQGMEMGRPSRIFVRGSMKSGNPVNIRVGGHCFTVAHGELEI